MGLSFSAELLYHHLVQDDTKVTKSIKIDENKLLSEDGQYDFLKVADDAFDLFDMDGNGTIERGGIE